MNDTNKIILASLLTFIATLTTGLFFFILQKNKDKKNKLFELHGMVYESLSMFEDIIYYTQCCFLMHAFHTRRMDILRKTLRDVAFKLELPTSDKIYLENSKEDLLREISYAKDDIEFHIKELNGWRIMFIQEKSKLQKYFYQINGLKNIIDLRTELNNVLEFEFVNKFDFESKGTIEQLVASDIHNLQKKLENDLKTKFKPLTEELSNKIFERIK